MTKVKAGVVLNARGPATRRLSEAEVAQIEQLVSQGAARTVIARALGVHVKTLRRMERRDLRVAKALASATPVVEPLPLTDEQIKWVEEEASRFSDDVLVAQRLELDADTFCKVRERDARVGAAEATGRAKMKRFLVRRLVEHDNVAGVIFALKSLFGLTESQAALVNIDMRKDFSTMTDEQLYGIAGRPPPEESAPTEVSTVPVPYSAPAPFSVLLVRAQRAVVAPSTPSVEPRPVTTVEGRVVGHRLAARYPTSKWERAEARRKDEQRVLAAGGAYTKSMYPEGD